MIVARRNDVHTLFRDATVGVDSVAGNGERAWTNHAIRYRLFGACTSTATRQGLKVGGDPPGGSLIATPTAASDTNVCP